MSRSNTSREILDALEVKIRETIREFEDLLETLVSNQLLNPQTKEIMISLEEIVSLRHEIDDTSIMSSLNSVLSKTNRPDELQKYILPFIELVNKLKQEYIAESIDPLPKEEEEEEEQDNDDSASQKNYFRKNKSGMVGLHDDYVQIKGLVIASGYSQKLKIITLFGMAGIGKTTLAKEVFGDPSVSGCFDISAWVDVGRNYRIEKIMQSIVAQVGSDTDKTLITKGEGERSILEECLRGCLVGRRYLIVLDDVWDESARNDITMLFPEDRNVSKVLVTTRLQEVARSTEMCDMRFLDEEESWDLLREKVFSDESACPPSLVAANPNPLLEEAYNQMSKVLLPSYNCLPQHLKTCFLYMGVFPQKHQISRSEIIKLWAVDRIFDEKVDRSLVVHITNNLFYNSLLMSGSHSSSYGSKTWRLHSSLWYLCRSESSKNKFFHIISNYNDGVSESIKVQRRLCVHKNILFGIKDVNKSMSSISTTRSLLCTRLPHQYPVPICLGLSLLRVLDAPTESVYISSQWK